MMSTRTDDALQRMMEAPLVVRAREFGTPEFWRTTMGEAEYATIMREIRESPLSLGALLEDAIHGRHMLGVERCYQSVAARPSNMLGGATPANLMVCAALEAGVPYFQTSDSLERKLHDSDIGLDINASFLRAPYDLCWIEFGETRTSPLRVMNSESGSHIAEGVIIRQSHYETDNADARTLDLVFVGSPKGKRWPMDDALQIFTIPITGAPSETVADLIDSQRAACATRQDLPAHMVETANAMWEDSLPLIEHLCKVLLYLNLKDARKSSRNERSRALEEIARKGQRKAERLRKRSRLTYDRIVIGQPSDTPGQHNGGKVTSVCPHARRGHFRLQPVGEGRKDRRVVWIEPTMVWGRAMRAEPPTKSPGYIVR